MRIRSLLLLALFVPWHAGAQPVTLRVAVAWPADPELRRGIEFGIEEARRSLALFRWSLAVDSAQGSATPSAVVALDSAAVAGVPVLLLACAPRTGAFVIASCASDSTVEWHHGLERYGAAQVNDRYRASTGQPMTAAAWKGWFAFKVLSESALRARAPSAERIAERLRDTATVFDGHKGVPLRFGADGVLRQPLYRIERDAAGQEIAREVRVP